MDTEKEYQCLTNFFESQTNVCPLYYDLNYDSFVLNNYSLELIKKESSLSKSETYIILENSFTKKDIGIYDGEAVEWESSFNFTLKSFDDYQTQVKSSKHTLIQS